MFTVVSDPPEDEGDCVDVAYASVDFVQVGSLFTYVRSAERQWVFKRIQYLTSVWPESFMTWFDSRCSRKKHALRTREIARNRNNINSRGCILVISRTLSEFLVTFVRSQIVLFALSYALQDSRHILFAFVDSHVLSWTLVDSRALSVTSHALLAVRVNCCAFSSSSSYWFG